MVFIILAAAALCFLLLLIFAKNNTIEWLTLLMVAVLLATGSTLQPISDPWWEEGIKPGNSVTVADTQTAEIKALGTAIETKSDLKFLGGGTISNQQAITYLEARDGGGAVLASVPAVDAVVYESDSKPRVVITQLKYLNMWIAPFPLSTKTIYEFHVPQGSVNETFGVSLSD